MTCSPGAGTASGQTGRLPFSRGFDEKIAIAIALSFIASTDFAGGMAEPVLKEEVGTAATAASAGRLIIPLLLLIAAVDGGTSGTTLGNS